MTEATPPPVATTSRASLSSTDRLASRHSAVISPTIQKFVWETQLPFTKETVFAWHTRPGAFQRLNPPWRPVIVRDAPKSLHVGERVTIALPVIGRVTIPWTLEHTEFEEGSLFCDEQVTGPFDSWHHRHAFIPVGDASCIMRDEVSFALPRRLSFLTPLMVRELKRLFHFRHTLLGTDLALQARWSEKPRRKILIAGASGFIGTALCAFLSTAGHTVLRLVRHSPTTPDERQWDPAKRSLDPTLLEDVDVVINLSGEGIASSLWSAQRKLEIVRSRVDATTALTEAILSARTRPELFISASGVGYYGDTGDQFVDEHSSLGKDFLSDVCRAWEGATVRLANSRCRVIHARLGVVLNARGGALQKMLLPFLCGVGGRLGTGKQFMSWIALEDLLGIVQYLIYTPEIRGPVNVVSPTAVTNQEFVKTLGKVLRRPTVIPIPAWLLEGALGELAQETLLSSSRALPSVLQDSSTYQPYPYVFPNLESALRFEIGGI